VERHAAPKGPDLQHARRLKQPPEAGDDVGLGGIHPRGPSHVYSQPVEPWIQTMMVNLAQAVAQPRVAPRAQISHAVKTSIDEPPRMHDTKLKQVFRRAQN
jgi:hypothetical protein